MFNLVLVLFVSQVCVAQHSLATLVCSEVIIFREMSLTAPARRPSKSQQTCVIVEMFTFLDQKNKYLEIRIHSLHVYTNRCLLQNATGASYRSKLSEQPYHRRSQVDDNWQELNCKYLRS